MRDLLGKRWAIAGVGLPGHLSELVRDQAENKREVAIDELIDRATLFPFHTAFMPEEVRVEVRAVMRGEGMLGGAAITNFLAFPCVPSMALCLVSAPSAPAIATATHSSRLHVRFAPPMPSSRSKTSVMRTWSA